jgi:hypothetical protein
MGASVNVCRAVDPPFATTELAPWTCDQVARTLRGVRALRAIPVVAVTPKAMPGDRERALEAAAAGPSRGRLPADKFVNEVERVIRAADGGDAAGAGGQAEP